MLEPIIGCGGVSFGSGSVNVMAVSRVCSHSMAGLRKLHSSAQSLSVAASWSHTLFEPMGDRIQGFVCARYARFCAVAAIEEPSRSYKKKRLSREERAYVIESFVREHMNNHNGTIPSVSVVLEETGGSRPVVKDILANLAATLGTGRLELDDDQPENDLQSFFTAAERDGNVSFTAVETDVPVADIARTTQSPSTAASEGVTKLEVTTRTGLGEIGTSADLWRRLRDLGHSQESEQKQQQNTSNALLDSSPQRNLQLPTVRFDSYDTDAEEDDETDFDAVADYPESSLEEGERDLGIQSASETTKRTPSSQSVSEDSAYGLFIRFLPFSATESDLRTAFQDCGEITRAQAIAPKGPSRKFTYGFVDFSTPEGLSKALKKTNITINGSVVLTEPCSRPKRPSRKLGTFPSNGTAHSRNEPLQTAERKPANGGMAPGVQAPVIVTGMGIGKGVYQVTVEGLAYPMPITAVEKGMSVHGEILQSELRRDNGGTYSALVEYKTEEARKSALESNSVYLGGRWCRVLGEPIMTTVVRVSNIGGKITESFMLSKCRYFGRVEEVRYRKEGVIDVYYHPSEKKNMGKILNRLSEISSGLRKWHASPAPRLSLRSDCSSPESKQWVDAQTQGVLDNLVVSLQQMMVDLEDLQDLINLKHVALSEESGSCNSPSVSMRNVQ